MKKQYLYMVLIVLIILSNPLHINAEIITHSNTKNITHNSETKIINNSEITKSDTSETIEHKLNNFRKHGVDKTKDQFKKVQTEDKQGVKEEIDTEDLLKILDKVGIVVHKFPDSDGKLFVEENQLCDITNICDKPTIKRNSIEYILVDNLSYKDYTTIKTQVKTSEWKKSKTVLIYIVMSFLVIFVTLHKTKTTD